MAVVHISPGQQGGEKNQQLRDLNKKDTPCKKKIGREQQQQEKQEEQRMNAIG